jgi:hypothetical protein
MKKLNFYQFTSFLVAALLFSSANLLTAQTFTYTDSWYEQGYNLQQTNRSGITLGYSVAEFTLADFELEGRGMKNIMLPNHFLFNDEGAPNLPGSGRFIAIPEGATPVLNITNVRTERFTNIEIAPAPRIPLDTEDGPLHYRQDPTIYQSNAFYPASYVQMSEVRQIRGVDVVVVGVTPFQYNPVTKELIIYRDIEFEVQFDGGTGQFGEERLRSRFWDPLLSDALINYQSLPEVDYASRVVKHNRSDEGCEYLIIVPDGPEFMDYAEQIKEHRMKQGIITEIVTLAEIGGNSAPVIETYIDDAYNNWDPAPAAVLLMADYGSNQTNTITSPMWDNYCVSDNIYADVDNDDMPEIVFARMTANNAAQLEVMVSKFINYEMDPPTSPDFYNHPITALGYQTERWFQICSESVAGFFEVVHGKSAVRINAIYSGNPQTGPWSTNQNTQMVLDVFGPNGLGYIPATPGQVNCSWYGTGTDVTNAINDGAFILQHRDHGSETGWGEPDYHNSDINNLTNTDLTFVFSINCLTGKYNWSQECFTEKFHRHTSNGVNSGALGVNAASEVSYSFVNDTYVWGMYDNMWPEFMPDFGSFGIEERGMLPSFGMAAGKLFLEQSNWPYNTNNKEVTYHLFHHHGDAFLELYSEVPEDVDLMHDGIILAGLDQFTVTAEVGAVVCLTVGDNIIGMTTGTGAPEVINIQPQSVGTMVTLTTTLSNHFRHEEVIEVIPAEGPYCIYASHEINDPLGNGNGLPDFDEEINLTFELKNVGLEDGENVEVTLTTTDPYITFIDPAENYGTVVTGESVTIEDAFCMYINDAVPDQHKVFITCNATNGEEEWESLFAFTVNAPELHINELTIDDTEMGNGDGELDPGEQVEMTITYSNNGHAVAYDVGVHLEGQSGFVEVLNPNQVFASIGFFGQFSKTFEVTIDEDAPEGIVVNFVNDLTMNAFYQEKVFPRKISAMCEDFETGDFEAHNWEFEGNVPWEITNQYPYQGLFSAMSGEVDNGQYSELKLTYKVMTADEISFIRKVSSDAGDKLKFFIGNNLMDEWSGTTGGWQEESFPVTAGTHVFRWVYQKDGSGSTGADCAWLDNIILPTPMTLTIWAGPNDKVCEGESFVISEAYGTDYTTVEWTTSGTGTFSSTTIINPSYTPSDDDILNGEVTLSLTLWDDQNNMVEDEMLLTFKTGPEAPPVPEGPDYVDLLSTASSVYITEGLEGILDYSWSITPEEAGTIEGASTMGTVTWNPDYLGTANITVAGINECGEGEYSEGFEVTIDNTVGIDNLDEDAFSLAVAPNPSSGMFYLSIINPNGTEVNLKVMNLLGGVIHKESVKQNGLIRKTLDLKGLPNGIYFMVVESDDQVISKKIIKK